MSPFLFKAELYKRKMLSEYAKQSKVCTPKHTQDTGHDTL